METATERNYLHEAAVCGGERVKILSWEPKDLISRPFHTLKL